MNRLILLSLLNEHDLYGYEINTILREKFVYFTKVSFSSVYYTLDKLLVEGLITKREEKVGNRPPRFIYSITQTGRKEYMIKLMKSINREGKRIDQMDPFNLPFSLMGRMPQEIMSDFDRKQLLEDRKKAAETLKEELEHMHTKVLDMDKDCKDRPELDSFTTLLIRRGIHHLEAEIKWLNEVLKSIEEHIIENSQSNHIINNKTTNGNVSNSSNEEE